MGAHEAAGLNSLDNSDAATTLWVGLVDCREESGTEDAGSGNAHAPAYGLDLLHSPERGLEISNLGELRDCRYWDKIREYLAE